MRDNPLHRHPSMQLLRRALMKEKRQQLIAAIVLTMFGFAAAFLAFGHSHIIGALGIVVTIIGLRLIYKYTLEQNVDDHLLVRLLFQQPEKIVWVYGVVTQHQPFGFNTTRNGVLYFHLVDGDDISVSLSAKKLKQVSKFLNRLLPKTVFGYTTERAQSYAREPKSLLRP